LASNLEDAPSLADLQGARRLARRRARERLRDHYVRFAIVLFGRVGERSARANPKLRLALEQAHIRELPETFVALTWFNSLVGALLMLLLAGGGLGLAAVLFGAAPSPGALAVVALAPILAACGLYVTQAVYPDYRVGERRRAIEQDLPYAVNYVAAMSSAGVIPAAIFRDLARQPVYGEVSREFAWLMRDMDLLSLDFMTAVNRAIDRSPSERFKEFLQGAKTTILSGGDLKTYFAQKAEQYMAENRTRQKEFLNGLSVLAESYVTVIIAGPLFLLVLLTIMTIVGNSATSTETFLFLLVFLLLPIGHGAFTYIIKNLKVDG